MEKGDRARADNAIETIELMPPRSLIIEEIQIN
jgi:hypothetical protein